MSSNVNANVYFGNSIFVQGTAGVTAVGGTTGVTVTSDVSSNSYVVAKRVPAGSLDVTQYTTGRVPLSTTTNLIQNYLSNAATVSTTGIGGYGPALFCPFSTNSYASFPANSGFVGSNTQSSNLFIEAWVYYPNVVQTQSIVYFSFPGQQNYGTYVNSGLLNSFSWNSARSAPTNSGTISITAGTWTHFAFFLRANGASSTLTIYRNGTASTTSAGFTPYYNPAENVSVCIGGDAYGAGNLQANAAYIYDVRIYSGGIVSTSGLTGVPGSPAPFGTTQPAYVTGTPSLRMSLQTQYFPGASTSPYGPCLTFPNTLGSYFYQPTTALNYSLNSGFTIEAWVNYASLANANILGANSVSSSLFIQKQNGPIIAGAYDWSFGPLSTGQISILWSASYGTNYGLISSGTITTGSWNHIVCQANTTGHVNMYINGVQQTLTAQNFAGSGTAVALNISVPGTNSNFMTMGQYSGITGGNFAVAKARVLFGANTYTTTSFTPSPNLGPIPAGGTVAWSLDSQYPLPTYPSIQDVTPLALQNSSYGSTPVPVGGVTSNIAGPFSNLNSIRFDGTGYIDYGNAATSTLTTNLWANSWTIEGWVYLNSYPSLAAQVIGRWASLSQDWFFWVNSSGILVFQYGGSGFTASTSSVVPLNTWTHIAATYDGTNSNLYASGTLAKTLAASTSSMSFNPIQNLQVGGSSFSYYLSGNLADVRVSNVARYTGSSYTVPTAPFVNDSNTLLLLKSLAGQAGSPLQVQGRGLNSVSLGGTSTVRAYPPAPMSSYLLDTTSNASVTYGQGKYVASASSEYAGPAWQAFDFNSSTMWQWDYFNRGNQYPGSSWNSYIGPVSTVDTLGTAYRGEWIQLQLPVSIILSSYTLIGPNTGYDPGSWALLGSRDGINWTAVHVVNNYVWTTSPQTITPTVNTTQAYSYYRWVMTAVYSAFSNYNIPIATISFNGTEEGFCITSDSKTGVGIANPQRALEVAGDLVVGGTISGGAGMGAFRNRIINGDMRIAQRGTSATIGAAGYFALDRWRTYSSTGTITVSQRLLTASDTPWQMGFSNSYLVTVVSGVSGSPDSVPISQNIEGYNVADLKWGTPFGQPVTVSFWIRTNFPSGSVLNYAIKTGGSYSYLVPLTTVGSGLWQYHTATIPPPPNGSSWDSVNGIGLTLNMFYYNGSGIYTAAPNTWLASNYVTVNGAYNWVQNSGNYIEITGVQLEKGTVATPFEFRPYATELALCQRYYYQVNSALNNAQVFGTGYAGTTSVAYVNVPYPVVMRAAPTVFSNSAPGTFQIGYLNTATPATGVVTGAIGQYGSGLNITTAAVLTAGNGVNFTAASTTGAFLGFHAEL